MIPQVGYQSSVSAAERHVNARRTITSTQRKPLDHVRDKSHQVVTVHTPAEHFAGCEGVRYRFSASA